jgi:hypothetical protein
LKKGQDPDIWITELQNEESENDNNQEVAFFSGQFKGKCRNCVAIGHKARDCKSKTNQNGDQNSGITTIFRKIRLMALIALIIINQVILRVIVSKLRINPTITVVQVKMTVKDKEFLIPKMFHLQQSP